MLVGQWVVATCRRNEHHNHGLPVLRLLFDDQIGIDFWNALMRRSDAWQFGKSDVERLSQVHRDLLEAEREMCAVMPGRSCSGGPSSCAITSTESLAGSRT